MNKHDHHSGVRLSRALRSGDENAPTGPALWRLVLMALALTAPIGILAAAVGAFPGYLVGLAGVLIAALIASLSAGAGEDD